MDKTEELQEKYQRLGAEYQKVWWFLFKLFVFAGGRKIFSDEDLHHRNLALNKALFYLFCQSDWYESPLWLLSMNFISAFAFSSETFSF